MNLLSLLRKALDDEKFGVLLVENPERALRESGIEPTPERIQALRDLEAILRSALRAFGGEFTDEI